MTLRPAPRSALASALALPVFLVAACADGEEIVRNQEPAERLADYELAVEARTEVLAETDGALPDEAIPDGPDYTRETVSDSPHDRFAVPDNTPYTDLAKDEQVGATTCPGYARLDAADFRDGTLPELSETQEAWLLEEGATRLTGFDLVRNGIERGYQPQTFDEVTLSVGGVETTVKPAEIGDLGAALMDLAPCAVIAAQAGGLDADALGIDAPTGAVRIQLLEVKHGGTQG